MGISATATAVEKTQEKREFVRKARDAIVALLEKPAVWVAAGAIAVLGGGYLAYRYLTGEGEIAK